MRYIALEEAFSIPELASRQRAVPMKIRATAHYAAEMGRLLPDFEEFRLVDMDANGIDIQVLSLTVPGIQADDTADRAVDNARFANDFLAERVAAHPDRFRGFAALPLQDPAAAIAELQRCVTELGFVGALVNDHTNGRYLDDPMYDDVWAALVDLDVPLYLHPGSIPLDDWRVLGGRPELYGASWSWQAEAGGHAMRIVYGGVFDRHPTATLILGHLGEFLSFQRSRFDSRYRTIEVERRLERMPSEYIGTNIVLTTSGILAPEAVQAAVLTAGEDAVMFAIDYPYEKSAAAVASVAAADLTESVKHKVAHGNAERLLHLTAH